MMIVSRGLAGMAFVVASSSAMAQQWKPSQIVLASPMQMQTHWLRCEIKAGPNQADYYELNCLDAHLQTDGKTKRRYETGITRAPGKWIKTDDPSFKPDMQFAAVRAAKAAPAARPDPAPAAAGGPAKRGLYTCFMWIGAVQTGYLSRVPGFTLTAGGYRHQNGGGGTTRRVGNVIEFVGGPLNGQACKMAPGKVHLYNKQRSWTVIDCTL